MNILALDTATLDCSVAIFSEGKLRAQVFDNSNQTHSKHLLNLISTVLSIAQMKLSEMDGFAVSNGPGSFTGLRIGISTIKGMAMSMDKPVIGISSLKALAIQTHPSSYLINTMIDARRKEVYYCQYRWEDGLLSQLSAEAVGSVDVALETIGEPCIFIGNGAYHYKNYIINKIRQFAYFASDTDHSIRASSIAYLAMEKFNKSPSDHLRILKPRYLRKADAQINRLK